MVFLALLTLLFVLVVVWIYNENYRRKKPPGPLRLPFIGTILQLGVDQERPRHELFRDISKKYGPITSIQLGTYPFVIFDDYETIKKLLNNDLWVNRFENGYIMERSFDKDLGIIFASGDNWKEMRRFTMRTLRDFGYGKQQSMDSVLDDEVKDLLAKIDRLSQQNGSVISMKQVFAMPVLNVLWRMVYSTKSQEDDQKLERLLELLEKAIRVVPMGGGGILMPFPLLRHIPFVSEQTGNNLLRKCNSEIRQYFADVLQKRREEKVYKLEPRDFVDAFLKEIDDQKKKGEDPNHYTDEQFIITMMDLFEGGTETTNNTMEFAMLYAMNHPSLQEKVQKEIDLVIGRNRLPTLTDRAKMPYTEAFLVEVQRYSNVVAMTLRGLTNDTWIDGYFMEKGTSGFLNLYSVHMNEKYWGNPESFCPERFLDEEGKLIAEKVQRVIAFGGGKRLCIGENLAKTTLFIYFTSLLQHFTFEHDESKRTEKKPAILGFTLSPAPYHAKVSKR